VHAFEHRADVRDPRHVDHCHGGSLNEAGSANLVERYEGDVIGKAVSLLVSNDLVRAGQGVEIPSDLALLAQTESGE
jgi:hypothetical protein